MPNVESFMFQGVLNSPRNYATGRNLEPAKPLHSVNPCLHFAFSLLQKFAAAIHYTHILVFDQRLTFGKF